MSHVRALNLGRMPYEDALEVQRDEHARVLASRESDAPILATIIAVEHDPPVITRSKRPTAHANIIASPDQLQAAGVRVHETDRGGDVTYHGPGQLVLYPIVDLNRAKLRLHDYVRLLEQTVIDQCTDLGLHTARDPAATGVWTASATADITPNSAKLCAIGIRVQRWVSLHGLALNITTNLDHFDLIVPCGLTGRRVTSIKQELGPRTPTLDQTRDALTTRLAAALRTASNRLNPARPPA